MRTLLINYSLERMLKIFRVKGGETGVCGTCMDVRGLTDHELWRARGPTTAAAAG